MDLSLMISKFLLSWWISKDFLSLWICYRWFWKFLLSLMISKFLFSLMISKLLFSLWISKFLLSLWISIFLFAIIISKFLSSLIISMFLFPSMISKMFHWSHDGVIKWKSSLTKDQYSRSLMFLLLVWINCSTNSRVTGERRSLNLMWRHCNAWYKLMVTLQVTEANALKTSISFLLAKRCKKCKLD